MEGLASEGAGVDARKRAEKTLADQQRSAAAVDAAKASAASQLADLQKQNADLLAKLKETTDHIANQSNATQQKLDEIIRQQNQSPQGQLAR
jgi:hypothetical protein